jgi:multimeric flavodoxin WrbA
MQGWFYIMIAINGGPRKNWNTDNLLNEALKGAASKGAKNEIINLYDLTFKGCISCFACKRKGVVLEQCSVKDALFPVLEEIRHTEALIIGSPIYFSCVTGETRSFLERLLFPYISYDQKPSSFGGKIKTAFIYTMNVPEMYLESTGYRKMFDDNQKLMERIFGHSEYLLSTETYQFDDYTRYASSMFDVEQRKHRHETVFKDDLKKAYELGQRMVS